MMRRAIGPQLFIKGYSGAVRLNTVHAWAMEQFAEGHGEVTTVTCTTNDYCINNH